MKKALEEFVANMEKGQGKSKLDVSGISAKRSGISPFLHVAFRMWSKLEDVDLQYHRQQASKVIHMNRWIGRAAIKPPPHIPQISIASPPGPAPAMLRQFFTIAGAPSDSDMWQKK